MRSKLARRVVCEKCRRKIYRVYRGACECRRTCDCAKGYGVCPTRGCCGAMVPELDQRAVAADARARRDLEDLGNL